MGVDHSANFGVGVQIKPIDLESKEEEYYDTRDYLDEILNDSEYSWGQSGAGNYTGKENDYYIFINNPIEDHGLKLNYKINKLKEFLQEKGIEYYGDVSVVGGVHTY